MKIRRKLKIIDYRYEHELRWVWVLVSVATSAL